MIITTAQGYSFHQLGGRTNQEDARYPNADTAVAGQRFFIVCDGVGGNEHGEVASDTVATTMGKRLAKCYLNVPFTDDMLLQVLDDAYIALDNTPQGGDMATTLTLVVIHAAGITMAHIGDSRIYQVRPGTGILYRSDDHSLVNQMVHAGQITPEQAINHPQSNVITRCMTATDPDQRRGMATVFHTADVQAGDYIFLCSDGVLHCLSDEQLVQILEQDCPDEEKMNTIAQASSNSTDNNTAWLVRVEDVQLSPKEEEALQAEEQDTDNTEAGDTLQTASNKTYITELESVTREKQSLLSKIRGIFS